MNFSATAANYVRILIYLLESSTLIDYNSRNLYLISIGLSFVITLATGGEKITQSIIAKADQETSH
jgi:hypothetical protein